MKFQLEPWTVDPEANELIAADERVRLSPKAMAVLAALHDARGEVMRRPVLCDEVGLSDEGLSRVVTELRQALGDSARTPRFIETIPRRGYRLRGPRAAPPATPVGNRAWWVLALAILGALLIVLWPQWKSMPGLTLGPPVDLTSFEGAAVLPRLVAGRVRFLRADATGASLGLWEIDLASLDQQPLTATPEVSTRLPAPGDPRRHADVRVGAGRCVVTIFDRGRAGSQAPCLDAPSGIDWQPDGEGLILVTAQGALARLDAASGAMRTLTRPPVGEIDRFPRVSPDGSTIVFTRGTAVISELMAWRVDRAHTATALTADGQMVFGAAWIDEQRLVYSSDRRGVRELWLQTLGDAGEAVPLGGLDAMSLAANGDRIVYERPIYDADIFVFDGSNEHRVADSRRYDNHPRLSPDEQRLAFISNRSGRPALWVADSSGGDAERIFESVDGRVSRPYWIDPTTLLVVAFGPDGSSVLAVSLDGGVEALIGPEYAPLEAIALADGQVLAVGEDAAGRGVFQLDRGTITRWSNEDVRRLEVSGQGIVMASLRDQSGLFRLEHGAPAVLQELPVTADGDQWALAGSTLIFDSDLGPHRYDLLSEELTPLPVAGTDIVGLGLDVSRDGQRVFISRNVARQIDLVSQRVLLDQDGS